MKKLIFRKFIKDTVFFFLLVSLTFGVIVWTLQAVNYLDFITEDGHSLKTYFQFTIYNFPKIIHRLIPFVFFISIFFVIINYDHNNELLIFWSNGISKISFANNLIFFFNSSFIYSNSDWKYYFAVITIQSKRVFKKFKYRLFFCIDQRRKIYKCCRWINYIYR